MRLLNMRNLYDKKFKSLQFEGQWLRTIGNPELTGSWIIYADTSNGKTTFCAMLVKYLSSFGDALYNSLEEGVCDALKKAFKRAGVEEINRIFFPEIGLETNDLIEVLKNRPRIKFVITDSVQFSDLDKNSYKLLLKTFPNKIFIFISHVKYNKPDGALAVKIWKDAHVKMHIMGFAAFIKSRFNDMDTDPIVIWDEGYRKFLHKNNKNEKNTANE